MKRKSNGYVVIAGCSRFGGSIASALSKRGKDVVIIDQNKDSFRKLSTDYTGFKVIGDVTDIDILIESGIGKASVFVAATDDDNINIMISQIAKEIFKVDKAISRLYETEKELVYDEFEIDIIRPTKLTIKEFENISMSEELGVI